MYHLHYMYDQSALTSFSQKMNDVMQSTETPSTVYVVSTPNEVMPSMIALCTCYKPAKANTDLVVNWIVELYGSEFMSDLVVDSDISANYRDRPVTTPSRLIAHLTSRIKCIHTYSNM